MTGDELRTLRGNIGNSLIRLESELEKLQKIADQIRANNMPGGRDVALAITNVETGLLWLRSTADKM